MRLAPAVRGYWRTKWNGIAVRCEQPIDGKCQLRTSFAMQLATDGLVARGRDALRRAVGADGERDADVGGRLRATVLRSQHARRSPTECRPMTCWTWPSEMHWPGAFGASSPPGSSVGATVDAGERVQVERAVPAPRSSRSARRRPSPAASRPAAARGRRRRRGRRDRACRSSRSPWRRGRRGRGDGRRRAGHLHDDGRGRGRGAEEDRDGRGDPERRRGGDHRDRHPRGRLALAAATGRGAQRRRLQSADGANAGIDRGAERGAACAAARARGGAANGSGRPTAELDAGAPA